MNRLLLDTHALIGVDPVNFTNTLFSNVTIYE